MYKHTSPSNIFIKIPRKLRYWGPFLEQILISILVFHQVCLYLLPNQLFILHRCFDSQPEIIQYPRLPDFEANSKNDTLSEIFSISFLLKPPYHHTLSCGYFLSANDHHGHYKRRARRNNTHQTNQQSSCCASFSHPSSENIAKPSDILKPNSLLI